MDGPDIAEELVKALRRPDGRLHLRPVHAIGIGATGYFEASDVARDYCIAEHFQGGESHHSALLERIRLRRCTRRLVGCPRNGDPISPRQRRRD